MRKSCFILLLLIVVVSYAEREVCSEACNKEYKNKKDLEECEAGCRLAVIYQFSLTGSVDVLDKCYEGCNKSYTENASACVYGCEHQPAVHHGSVEFMISNNEPTFGVVKDAMRKMFRGMSNMFSYFGGSMMNSKSSEVHDYSTEEEIIDNLHREMQRKMELFNEHMHNMIRGMQSDSESSEETEHQNMMGHWDRPNGHFVNAFFGKPVGNRAEDGTSIVQVHPASMKNSHLLGYQGENPMTSDQAQSHSNDSWISRIITRARRLSVLSQWLVCTALLLCFLSMLSISFAILKQVRSQRYRNLQNVSVIVPSRFGGELPTKKIPLDSPTNTTMDYPLIHDSPPPAYDQLSVHRKGTPPPS